MTAFSTSAAVPVLPTDYVSKPVLRADLSRVVDLLAACETIDQLEDNRSLAELQRSFDLQPPKTVQRRRLWYDPSGCAVGYGHCAMWYEEGDTLEASPHIKVHPDHRSTGLENTILSWCEQQALEIQDQVVLWTGARDDRPHYGRLYERHGYRPVRQFRRLALSLVEPTPAPQFPEGFTVRCCRGEADIDPWVAMFNQTFIDHWEFTPLLPERRRYRIHHPTYRPELDWVAQSPTGTLAAFCGCHISPEANARTGRQEGWVALLGTRRGFRRRGLARAMLLHGLQGLRQAGMTQALIGVDCENPNQAERLYRSVGFQPDRTTLSYKKVLTRG